MSSILVDCGRGYNYELQRDGIIDIATKERYASFTEILIKLYGRSMLMTYDEILFKIEGTSVKDLMMNEIENRSNLEAMYGTLMYYAALKDVKQYLRLSNWVSDLCLSDKEEKMLTILDALHSYSNICDL